MSQSSVAANFPDGVYFVALQPLTSTWNELLFGLIFITSPDLQTLPVAISYLINGDVFRWGLTMAGSVLAYARL